MITCLTQLRPTLALSRAEQNRNRRRELQARANKVLTDCFGTQRQTLLEALSDRRAGIAE